MGVFEDLEKQRAEAEVKLKLAAQDILADTFGEDVNPRYFKSVVIDIDYKKGGGIRANAHIRLTLNR